MEHLVAVDCKAAVDSHTVDLAAECKGAAGSVPVVQYTVAAEHKEAAVGSAPAVQYTVAAEHKGAAVGSAPAVQCTAAAEHM